jgi:cystathionine beta-lyase family protein involved in aluminum resistance
MMKGFQLVLLVLAALLHGQALALLLSTTSRSNQRLFAGWQESNDEASALDAERIISEASTKLIHRFHEIDLHTKRNMKKILKLYQDEKIDASAFHGVLGYGHGDIGREKLDNIVAKLMGAEAALVRLQLFSGTHAISTALFACLRPGDAFLGVSGHPYDTLEEVIGLRGG